MSDTQKINTLTLSILEGAVAYHRWIFDKIRPYLGKDILEVGCGIGSLTDLLLRQGRVIVADLNEEYLRTVGDKFRTHPNLKEILIWDVQQEPPKHLHMAIDTIVCSNVLEHVRDDDSVLKIFFQLLPLEGKAIFLVPALKGLYNVLDKELSHFRRYSKKEMMQKLTANGFKICHLEFFNFFGILGWFTNGTLLRRRLLSGRQVSLFNRLVPFFIQMEKIIPNLAGQSLIAIGEKG